MAGCTIHSVDTHAMTQCITDVCRDSMLLRLAWQAGLSRQELQALTWQHVNLSQGILQLPQRRIALTGDLFVALGQWKARCPDPVWVLPGRSGMLPLPSLSRLAQQLLQRHHLDGVRLSDLRHDYIITQLHHRPWGSLCRELAMDEGALRKAYGGFVTPPREKADLDASALTQLLSSQMSLGALAVGLAYHMGLMPSALLSLKWETITPQTVPAPLVPLVTHLRPINGTGLVFHTTAAALSRLARQTLLPYGLDGVTLQALSKQQQRQKHRAALDVYFQTHSSLTGAQGQALFSLPKSATYRLLQTWVAAGSLVQVGAYYYHGAQVPPVADHQALVLSQAQRKRVIYVSDVESLLHIRPQQCQQLLQALVKSGHLVGSGNRYEVPYGT